MPPAPPQPILSGGGTTDAQGKLTIAIPADLKDSRRHADHRQRPADDRGDRDRQG